PHTPIRAYIRASRTCNPTRYFVPSNATLSPSASAATVNSLESALRLTRNIPESGPPPQSGPPDSEANKLAPAFAIVPKPVKFPGHGAVTTSANVKPEAPPIALMAPTVTWPESGSDELKVPVKPVLVFVSWN